MFLLFLLKKTGHAIRALGRMASLQKSLSLTRSSSQGSGSPRSSTSPRGSLSRQSSGAESPSVSLPLMNGSSASPSVESFQFSSRLLDTESVSEADHDVNDNKINGKENSDTPSTNGVNMKSSSSEKLRFVNRMQDFEVFEGDSALFEVQVEGPADLSVSWKKDHMDIKDKKARKYICDYEEDRKYVLKVKNCVSADEGLYSCHVSCESSAVACSAELTVHQVKL